MSVLTKTALIYASFFAVLTLFILPITTDRGPISEAFADTAKGMLIIAGSSVVVALISEGFHRVFSRSRSTCFSIEVPVLQIVAQLFFTGVLLSQVKEHDTMGISYLLLALFMSYTVKVIKKSKQSKEFWMVNACCAIVIGSCQSISLITGDMVFGTSPEGKLENIFFILQVILSCAIFGIPSYLNYLRLEKSE